MCNSAPSATDQILDELSKLHPRGYDLSLGRITRLLDQLDKPQNRIAAPFHVAGTNGKGSTIANLRAILEAADLRVHTHTSPHLVSYHERFRLATDAGTSSFADDAELAETIEKVASANAGQAITIFEILIASMFDLFTAHKADHTIIEVGLGGRFDCTNVMDSPHVTIITPVSLDHQAHLGDTIAKIAFEKAGIIKSAVPLIISEQDDDALEVITKIAHEKGAPTKIARQDFDWYEERGHFIYQDEFGLLELPLPALHGEHQLANSATAIAATRINDAGFSNEVYEKAMKTVTWPGRMQPISDGKLHDQMLAKNVTPEVWVDGGHNIAAAQEISQMLTKLDQERAMPLTIITAMLETKDPAAFFESLKLPNAQFITVPITTSNLGIDAEKLADVIKSTGQDAYAADGIVEAFDQVAQSKPESMRILLCGSLYLAGDFLKKNGTPPQ